MGDHTVARRPDTKPPMDHMVARRLDMMLMVHTLAKRQVMNSMVTEERRPATNSMVTEERREDMTHAKARAKEKEEERRQDTTSTAVTTEERRQEDTTSTDTEERKAASSVLNLPLPQSHVSKQTLSVRVIHQLLLFLTITLMTVTLPMLIHLVVSLCHQTLLDCIHAKRKMMDSRMNLQLGYTRVTNVIAEETIQVLQATVEHS